MKQNIKNSANVAKDNRGKQKNRRLFDKSKVEYYEYYEFDYFKSKYLNKNENKNNNSSLKNRKTFNKLVTKSSILDRRDKIAIINESEGNKTNFSKRV